MGNEISNHYQHFDPILPEKGFNKGKIVADGTNEDLMSSFMGNIKLRIEIKNATEKSIKDLNEKIDNIKLINTKEIDKSYILDLEYPEDKDPREELFKYAINSNWIIMEMNKQSANLESIFRKLTMEGASNE